MPKIPSSLRRRAQKTVEIMTIHPDGRADDDRLRALALNVMKRENWHFRLKVIMADDAELRRLHRLFLGEDEPTDVMAFPADDEGDASEIYISLDQALVQALEDGESVQRAAERLLVHGLLHLGGWRDDSDVERRRMLDYGESYLFDY